MVFVQGLLAPREIDQRSQICDVYEGCTPLINAGAVQKATATAVYIT